MRKPKYRDELQCSSASARNTRRGGVLQATPATSTPHGENQERGIMRNTPRSVVNWMLWSSEHKNRPMWTTYIEQFKGRVNKKGGGADIPLCEGRGNCCDTAAAHLREWRSRRKKAI